MITMLLTLLLLDKVVQTSPMNVGKCTQQAMYRSLEVTCIGIPSEDEWRKLNKTTTHMIITCSRSESDSYHSLFSNQLFTFPKLEFFCVRNCPLFDLPTEYFTNLMNLESVVLNDLPLKSLDYKLFKNSSNLRELTLMRLESLQHLHPRFMDHQNQLKKLHIIQSNITADQLKPSLLSMYVTITDLYWRKNKQKLFFQKNYFHNFKFDNLVLENNGIDNTDFLFYVHTKYLSLRNNPISTIDKFQLPRLDGLESLNLAFTGIYGTFPDAGMVLPTVYELILSDNRIEALPVNIDAMIPSLRILDIRNNRLTTLPSTLYYMLTKNAGRVLLRDNIFHCNCEMQWIIVGYPALAEKIMCRTVTTVNDTQPANKILTTVHQQSKLQCIPPQLQMELSDQLKERDYSVTMERNDMKVYTVVLYPGEVLNWRCEGRGDPAPKLKWIFEGQTYKVAQAPLRRYETRTTMTNLFVELNNTSMKFICQGLNIVGNTAVELRLIRLERLPAKPAKIVYITKKDSNATRSSMMILLSTIFVYLLTLHKY